MWRGATASVGVIVSRPAGDNGVMYNKEKPKLGLGMCQVDSSSVTDDETKCCLPPFCIYIYFFPGQYSDYFKSELKIDFKVIHGRIFPGLTPSVTSFPSLC